MSAADRVCRRALNPRASNTTTPPARSCSRTPAAAQTERLTMIEQAFGEHELATRAEIRPMRETGGRAQWVRAWRANPSSIVLDWCRDEMALISADTHPLPDPRQLPSVWHSTAYRLARIYLVGVEGAGPSRIDFNDLMDHFHYADAAYSAALVTDDARLHRTSEHCPEPRIRTIRFQDWAGDLLSARARG